ncbi:MAG: cytochrome C [Candidatus Zixiibacteriota bacterium]|nr:MAG: cytochrome C [candidate division Zixibacteria bacterium]
MTQKTAKGIFWVGTLSSLILFLALTVDTHRQVAVLTNADKLSDEVVAGKKVFQKYNCNVCHTILGFGAYYAPDLTRVYDRRGEAYIRRVLEQPEVVLANSFRKMPQQNLSAQEVDRLAAFFAWVNEIDTNDWPPQDSKTRSANRLTANTGMTRGAALFKGTGCFECHTLEGVGREVGPALDGVGDRYDAAALERLIADPHSVNPSAVMPPYGEELSAADIQAIADFLSRQNGGVR